MTFLAFARAASISAAVEVATLAVRRPARTAAARSSWSGSAARASGQRLALSSAVSRAGLLRVSAACLAALVSVLRRPRRTGSSSSVVALLRRRPGRCSARDVDLLGRQRLRAVGVDRVAFRVLGHEDVARLGAGCDAAARPRASLSVSFGRPPVRWVESSRAGADLSPRPRRPAPQEVRRNAHRSQKKAGAEAPASGGEGDRTRNRPPSTDSVSCTRARRATPCRGLRAPAPR